MKSAEISIKRPVATVLIIIMVTILGFISIPNIPVSFWPEFVAPTLVVLVPYPGVGPEEIEEQIAKPLEEELSTIEGVEEIETTCMEGNSQVYVRFGWGIDFEEAKIDVQESTNKASSSFPQGAFEPQVLQVQDFLPPGIELGFYAKTRSLNELRNIVEEKFKNRFLRLENVATVDVTGGYEQHIAVEVNPDQLYAHHLTLQQISNTLRTQNMNVPSGKLKTNLKNFLVRTSGKYQNIKDIENTVIKSPKGSQVYLKEVATVHLENKERSTITRLDGKELIGLAMREKSGGNTLAMCDEVKEELELAKQEIPPDVTVDIIRDQSVFIKTSINNVIRNAVIGAFLAGFIIILFLGNLRNTLIIIISIPLSIIATFVLIDQFGLTINTISLGGLALGVGMIVDSSIVVIENVFRHLRQKKSEDRLQTVVHATGEVGSAVTASTLTSIVVFLPMAFLIGLAATLLGELALTVVFALSISVIVALTIVPMLSFKLMRVKRGESTFNIVTNRWQKLFDHVLTAYRPTLNWALNHRLLTIFFAILILLASIFFIIPQLDVELLPAINQGEFQIEITLPEGTRIEVTDKLTQKIEKNLIEQEEVKQVYSVVGLLSVRGEEKSNSATITVNLKNEYQPFISDFMDTIRNKWTHVPGLRLVVRQTDVTEGMRKKPINVRVVGKDLEVLTNLGRTMMNEIEKVPGAVNLTSSIEEGLSEFDIKVNRTKAADLGVTSSQIYSIVPTALSGVTSSVFSSHGEEYDITLSVNEDQLRTINDLLNLPLTTMKGKVVPLRAVATVSLERSPSQIKRFDQQRVVEITGDVAGRSQREVQKEIERKMSEINLPSDYYITYGGQSKAIADSFRSLGIALLIAILLVYVVMGSQFNSFIHPFTIALTIPLALIGVLLGLLLFSANISMNAFLGMIMLVGIVVNNGILLIDYINQLRRRGMPKKEAILEGGTVRFRPVLITALTTIFGMLPIAIGFGEGAEALKPLGAVVVGGLATSTFLTLLVVPCVYSLLDRLTKS